MKKKLILALTIVSLCISSIGCSKTTTNDNTNSVIESTENIENINNEDVALDEELGGLMSIFWTQKVKLFYAALLANNSH